MLPARPAPPEPDDQAPTIDTGNARSEQSIDLRTPSVHVAGMRMRKRHYISPKAAADPMTKIPNMTAMTLVSDQMIMRPVPMMNPTSVTIALTRGGTRSRNTFRPGDIPVS